MTQEIAKSNRGTMVQSLEAAGQLLVLSYLLSFAAGLFWIFDLFSHFLLQYIIGGLILFVLFLALRRYKYAGAVLLVALASFVEMRLSLSNPLQFSPPESADEAAITLVQYNHYVNRYDFASVESWLQENGVDFDLVVLQEASYRTREFVKKLEDIYPHQVHEPRDHAFGMVILSRHELLEQSVIPISGPVMETFLIRMVLDIPATGEKLAVYALHAVPPMEPGRFKQRNIEIMAAAEHIAADDAENVVLIGDWNLTPYSPFFARLRKTAGLEYQSFGLLLTPTWPAFNRLSILQIPIDHVLHSPSLRVLDKQAGPSFGSDHHALVTTIGLRQ